MGGQKRNKCPLLYDKEGAKEEDPLTWANKRIVVSFIETGNPGGEAGLGDRGRKEFSARHEAWEISYLMEVLQLIW